ncbi:hypothetical protein BDQ12DRAFT_691676 [Crucibulum laeve]|uniref:Uncharacterized protein n=1 Tax=Crucibulum laeve TaxID=68775 RepID=A0A5C3LMA0_9AGAR|nr:hypothetical protein BDQ12DRAFT_691676 [Crucibulum laeve]
MALNECRIQSIKPHRSHVAASDDAENTGSPIGTLHSEILLQIFRYLVPYIQIYNEMGPPIITQVCSYWRDLILQMPSFWSYIDIQIWGLNETTKHLHALQECLSRSKNQPLTFMITAWSVGRHDGNNESILIPIIESLLAHSDRWIDVIFNIEEMEGVFSFLEGGITQFPILQSVSISRSSIFEVKGLKHAPQLRSLSLCSKSFGSIIVNWDNITTLTLQDTDVPLRSLNALLLKVRNLRYLNMEAHQREYCAFDAAAISELQALSLKYLKSMSISGIQSQDNMAYIIPIISAPSLENLSLLFRTCAERDFLIDRLPQFYENSASNTVQTLTIGRGFNILSLLSRLLEQISGIKACLQFASIRSAEQFIYLHTYNRDVTAERFNPFNIEGFKRFEDEADLIEAMDAEIMLENEEDIEMFSKWEFTTRLSFLPTSLLQCAETVKLSEGNIKVVIHPFYDLWTYY